MEVIAHRLESEIQEWESIVLNFPQRGSQSKGKRATCLKVLEPEYSVTYSEPFVDLFPGAMCFYCIITATVLQPFW